MCSVGMQIGKEETKLEPERPPGHRWSGDIDGSDNDAAVRIQIATVLTDP